MSGSSRYAPAVRFPVDRSRFLLRVLLAQILLAAAGLALWSLTGTSGQGWRVIAAWVLWLLVSFQALFFWRRSTLGELVWDGRCWAFQFDKAQEPLPLAGEPRVHWDLQSLILVSITDNAGGSYWLWLHRSRRPERWADLRRALYSRASAPEGRRVPVSSL